MLGPGTWLDDALKNQKILRVYWCVKTPYERPHWQMRFHDPWRPSQYKKRSSSRRGLRACVSRPPHPRPSHCGLGDIQLFVHPSLQATARSYIFNRKIKMPTPCTVTWQPWQSFSTGFCRWLLGLRSSWWNLERGCWCCVDRYQVFHCECSSEKITVSRCSGSVGDSFFLSFFLSSSFWNPNSIT